MYVLMMSQSQHGGRMTATQRLFLLSSGLQSRQLTLRTSLCKLSSDLHTRAPAFTHTLYTVINTEKPEWKNALCLGKAEMTED